MITLNRVDYHTKESARKAVKSILENHKPNDQLVGDEYNIIVDLLAYHPESQKKIGAGISQITIKMIPPYFSSKGFWITRLDGSGTDFSYLKCFSGSDTPLLRFSKAARSAISKTIMDYRSYIFSSGGIMCPMTGIPLDFETCHIDHAPPNVFSKIVRDFIDSYRIDLTLVAYLPRMDGSTTEHFLDHELESRFIEFHNERAVLRAVDPEWNVKIGNRSQV